VEKPGSGGLQLFFVPEKVLFLQCLGWLCKLFGANRITILVLTNKGYFPMISRAFVAD
jgi:hypothetical protein